MLVNRDCMSGNPLQCITARFNVDALHVFSVGKMVLRNDIWRFQWVVEGFRLGVGDFSCEGFQSDKAFVVADMVSDWGVFERG